MPNRLLIATCLILIGITPPASAQGGGGGGGGLFGGNPPPPAPSPTAMLRIRQIGGMTWRGNLPNDTRSLQSEIERQAWRSQAAKKAMTELGLTEQTAKAALKVSVPASSGQIHLALTLPSDTQAARESATRLLDALTSQIVPDAVNGWADETNQIPLLRAEESLEYARKEFDDARTRATDLRRKIREAAEVLDPSPEAVRGATSRLEQERQRIQLELVGQNARLKALQERVSKLAETTAAKAENDPIAAELEQIVKMREKAAQRFVELQKQGAVNAPETGAAEAQLAEAKAKLLERRESAARSAGTELLADLNKELITLSITNVENEARLDYVGKRLHALARATDLVDDLEQLQATATRAAKQLEAAESERQQARRQATIAPAFSASVHWDEPKIEQIPKQPAANQP